eukprot:c12292_g1_i1.p1 GENE.c12292_g1_i1~~c12292_g1_i1.p1  ORF type:complete len:1600 (+),score=427.88 c12292_g1_i1:315-4802(+)
MEIMSYIVASVCWLMVSVVMLTELDRGLTKKHAWVWRFVCAFTFAGHCAKLHFVVGLADEHNYFFFLYLVQFSLHGLLTLLALLSHPPLPRDPAPKSVETELSRIRPDSTVGDGDGDEKIFPEFRVNFVSWLTFWWLMPLLRHGYNTPLELKDIWKLEKFDRNENVHQRFRRIFLRERSLLKTLVKCWTAEIFISFCWKMFNDASQFVGPYFLKLLLQSIAKHESWKVGYFYAMCIFAGQLVGMVGENIHFQKIMRVGFQVRSALTAEIFRRGLVMGHGLRSEFPVGKINNLVTSDCEALQNLTQRVMNLWSAPVRITMCMVMLYQELGPSSLVALAVLLMMIPIQSKIVDFSKKATRNTLAQTDERTKSTREVIQAMDIVKMYAWEDAFRARINAIRSKELGWIKRGNLLMAFNSFVVAIVPVLVTVLTLTVYSFVGNELTASVAFTSLTLFSVLRNPLFVLPDLIISIANTQVSLVRLEKCLLPRDGDEIESRSNITADCNADDEIAIRLGEDAKFSWDSDNANPTLSHVPLEIKRGSLVAVVGATGSGKSSLLNAILGEMPRVFPAQSSSATTRGFGGLCAAGPVAFVPQQAWIFNDTIKENIVFCAPWDEARFQKAIEAANLVTDLELQPAGEFTEIGEKGVNLSGGQKQRVSIARAVYADTNVVILDDPLSALDAKVGRRIFEKCVRGVLDGKTRIMATNQIHFLPQCDHVIFLQKGRIAGQGSYDELMAHNEQFKKFLGKAVEDNAETSATTTASQTVGGNHEKDEPQEAAGTTTDSKNSKEPKPVASEGKLVKAEHRESGVVSQAVVMHYANAMGGKSRLIGLMFSYAVTETLRLLASWWMSLWTNSMEQQSHAHSNSFFVGGFSLLSLAQILTMLFTQVAIAMYSYQAATTLHDLMLSKILRVPLSFLHANPLGRVLNRFSKDQADIDRSLAGAVSMFLRSVTQLLSTLVMISIITPFTSTVFIPLFALFVWVFSFFQRSAREVKRLDSLTRSPVYAFFNQTLVGSATVRAFGGEGHVMGKLGGKVDDNIALNLVSMSMNRWLSVMLEVIGSFMILASAVFAVVQQGSASDTGLSLSFALGITGLMTASIRLGSMAENSFNSVERVLEYTTLESEAPPIIENNRPPPGWPSQGEVSFSNVYMSYRPDLPPVLQGLTVNFPPSSKVGICGRTGAGKSSIFNTLFRLVEPSQGHVIVDGIKLDSLGLHDVRRALSIIPQEPVLFVGSVRDNLDPFKEVSDTEIWTALEQAHLKQLVEQLPGRLSAKVSEGGENFSVGQRQLMCLARALLRSSKVLVLDEATASVDVQTDALIQTTIREAFKARTMLIIAHRLNTIIDCDYVLVLDAGKALEFGTPRELLSRSGVFASLVDDTGPAMARLLRSIAEGSVDRRQLLRGASQSGIDLVSQPCNDHVIMARLIAAHATLKAALSGNDPSLDAELAANKVSLRDFHLEMFGLIRELAVLASTNVEASGTEGLDDATLILLQNMR